MNKLIQEANCSVTINVEPIPFAGVVTITGNAPNKTPAAWFYYRPGETGTFMCADAEAMKGIEKNGWVTTPLYTHPVKELTDEEIVSLYKETEADKGGIREFARAILRKAQEK